MICLRCKQRGERYSRQVARDRRSTVFEQKNKNFAAKAAEVKKRAGRCIGELMEEDRKPGRLARQKAPAQEEKSFHPFVLSRTACPLSPPHASSLPHKKLTSDIITPPLAYAVFCRSLQSCYSKVGNHTLFALTCGNSGRRVRHFRHLPAWRGE